MRVTVRFFAAVREQIGQDTVQVDLPDSATVADLRAALAGRFPAVARWVPHLLFAVDRRYAADSTQLGPDAEIAGFPPVSGG